MYIHNIYYKISKDTHVVEKNVSIQSREPNFHFYCACYLNFRPFT